MLNKKRCLPRQPAETVEITGTKEQATLDDWAAGAPAIYQDLVGQLNAEAATRLRAIFPSLDEIDEIKFAVEQWKSIKSTARQPTPDFQKGIDIYTAAKQALVVVAAFTTQAQVDAYDAQTDPGWPA